MCPILYGKIRFQNWTLLAYLFESEKEDMDWCVNLVDRIKLMSKRTNSIRQSTDNSIHLRTVLATFVFNDPKMLKNLRSRGHHLLFKQMKTIGYLKKNNEKFYQLFVIKTGSFSEYIFTVAGSYMVVVKCVLYISAWLRQDAMTGCWLKRGQNCSEISSQS